jgi:hypothetical protein
MANGKWELGEEELVVGGLWRSQYDSSLLILTMGEWEEARRTIRLHPM